MKKEPISILCVYAKSPSIFFFKEDTLDWLGSSDGFSLFSTLKDFNREYKRGVSFKFVTNNKFNKIMKERGVTVSEMFRDYKK